jgi:hypothetical protein
MIPLGVALGNARFHKNSKALGLNLANGESPDGPKLGSILLSTHCTCSFQVKKNFEGEMARALQLV